MKTTGFICEFNPLHNGHRHFIKEARRATGADYLIAVMSGDYVQRGEPAVLPMHERAGSALEAGCDLILQLPDPWAVSSAQAFAEGGMRILGALGCVDEVCFGAEADDPSVLTELASWLVDHEKELQSEIREHIKSGATYAAARARAIASHHGDDAASLLSQPNNQLALSYLQALRKLRIPVTPHALRRDESFESSSSIRQRAFETQARPDGWLCADDFSLLLKDRLLTHSAEQLQACADVSKPLANRIKNHQNELTTWAAFAKLLHTKEMTLARVNRSILHIVLGIKKDDPLYRAGSSPLTLQTEQAPFIRVLGFKKSAAPLLAAINKTSSVPVLTSLPSDTEDYAGNLYQSVRAELLGLPYRESHQIQPVITD